MACDFKGIENLDFAAKENKKGNWMDNMTNVSFSLIASYIISEKNNMALTDPEFQSCALKKRIYFRWFTKCLIFICSIYLLLFFLFWIFRVLQHLIINGAWSYFSKLSLLFHLMNHHSKDVNFKFRLKGQAILLYEAILYFVVASILVCKLNYGYHK